MTGTPNDSRELEAITGPLTPPPQEPDPDTEKAIIQADQAAARLTPTQQIVAAKEQHLADVRTKRDRLEAENKRLQSELDQLRPEHARLIAEFAHACSASATATWFFAISGILVSAAAYWEPVKTPILGFGIGLFACGLWVFFFSVRGAQPRR